MLMRDMDEYSTIENTLAWLGHYNREFNESPHINIGRLINLLQKYLSGYEYK